MSRSGERKDLKVRSTELSTRAWRHGPEEIVGVDEAHSVASADGREAQGLRQEGLAHTGGADEQDMLVPGEELQREDSVQEPAVQSNARRTREKSSRRQVSSNPAERTLTSIRRFSRRLTSSERMISRAEA